MPPRRRADRRRRGDDKRSQDIKGYWLLGGSLAFVAILGVLGVTVLRPKPIDRNTGCPISSVSPDAHTVILVDETDQLSRVDLRYAEELIQTEYSWLPVGGRLTVRTIVSDDAVGEDIVVCRLDDGSSVLGIAKTAKKVKRDYELIAGKRLTELLAKLQTAPEQTSSPILESIRDTFDQSDFSSSVGARRLVVLSDMAQHSDLSSHYGRRSFSLNSEARTQSAETCPASASVFITSCDASLHQSRAPNTDNSGRIISKEWVPQTSSWTGAC